MSSPETMLNDRQLRDLEVALQRMEGEDARELEEILNLGHSFIRLTPHQIRRIGQVFKSHNSKAREKVWSFMGVVYTCLVLLICLSCVAGYPQVIPGVVIAAFLLTVIAFGYAESKTFEL